MDCSDERYQRYSSFYWQRLTKIGELGSLQTFVGSTWLPLPTDQCTMLGDNPEFCYRMSESNVKHNQSFDRRDVQNVIN